MEENEKIIDENIKVTEILLEIYKENKNIMLKSEEKLGDLLSELITKELTDSIIEESKEMFLNVVEVEKQIKEIEFQLAYLKILKAKLF